MIVIVVDYVTFGKWVARAFRVCVVLAVLLSLFTLI